MTRRYARVVALLLLLAFLPALSGCGGGIIELALTAKKLYGAWKLYKLFADGRPTWIEAAIAVWKFKRDLGYQLSYVDGSDTVIAEETGTWDIDNGVLVLEVDESTIYPGTEGKTVRLPGHFEGGAADTLSLTRRVTEGQVVVSQEEVYERVTE